MRWPVPFTNDKRYWAWIGQFRSGRRRRPDFRPFLKYVGAFMGPDDEWCVWGN